MSKSPVKGPSYITPDGEFLDIYKSGIKSHGAVDEWLYLAKYITDDEYYGVSILLRNNYIRVNDGSNFLGECVVELPELISTPQIYSLERWFNWLPQYISILEVSKGKDLYTFDTKRCSVTLIIDFIKNLFSDVLPEKEMLN